MACFNVRFRYGLAMLTLKVMLPVALVSYIHPNMQNQFLWLHRAFATSRKIRINLIMVFRNLVGGVPLVTLKMVHLLRA